MPDDDRGRRVGPRSATLGTWLGLWPRKWARARSPGNRQRARSGGRAVQGGACRAVTSETPRWPLAADIALRQIAPTLIRANIGYGISRPRPASRFEGWPRSWKFPPKVTYVLDSTRQIKKGFRAGCGRPDRNFETLVAPCGQGRIGPPLLACRRPAAAAVRRFRLLGRGRCVGLSASGSPCTRSGSYARWTEYRRLRYRPSGRPCGHYGDCDAVKVLAAARCGVGTILRVPDARLRSELGLGSRLIQRGDPQRPL